jgi:hypothetical protein
VLKLIYSRLKAFQELLALLIFYLGWSANPFDPNLVVTYSVAPYLIPASVDPTTASRQSSDPQGVEIVTVTLKNRGSTTIGGIELQVNGVRRLLDSGARASFKRFDAQAARVGARPGDGALFFESIRELPPGHNIQIQLIAETYKLILTNRLQVTSDAKEARTYETAQTSGIFVFLEEHSSFLGGLLVAAALVIGARRLVAPKTP